MSNWDSRWQAVGAFVALATLALLVWQQLRAIRKQNAEQLRKQEEQRRRDEEFKLDWNGSSARPGVPAIPGVMERLRALQENTSTLPDRMTAVERRMDSSEVDRAEMRARLDDHIKLHQYPPFGGQ